MVVPYVSLLVHARGHVEWHLTLVVFREVLSLVVKKCLEILVFKLLVFRSLTHVRHHSLVSITMDFVGEITPEAIKVAPEPVKALLIEESLRQHLVTCHAIPTAVMLELFIVEVLLAIVIINDGAHAATTTGKISSNGHHAVVISI